MKKIKIYLTGFLMMAIGLQSCQLESEMYNVINPTMYLKNARDARDLVTANAYGVFQNNEYNGIFNIATGVFLTADVATDYGFCSWGGSTWLPIEFARWTPQDTRNITHGWDFLNNISKMTLTIDRISGIEMDETLKQQYIAELRCGRGFLAFLVYDLFGPIILADLETLTDPLAEKILPRLSEEETRNFIVTELTEAAKSLPYSYKKEDADYGRFTKGVCHMVLLKLYMQTHQWDKAITEARELTKPEYGYTLVKSYPDIFTVANEKNAETIWAVNCLEGYQIHLWYPHVLPSNISTFNGGWGGYKMTWQFFETFEPNDQRKETIVYEYTTQNGEVLNATNRGSGANSLEEGVFPIKYKIEPNVGDHCQTDWIIYRYADALTLLAEAIVRQNNVVTDEAVDLLNQVRTRAGLDAYSRSDFAGSRDFLDKLLLERAHEFYYEGCRRQDLIRDGSYVEVMKKKCQDFGETPIITENYTLFPLPESAIIEGQGLVKQNPGY
ncbi:RagB/SusD family nutrient uptake outer membrane protein [termite gut metagenome]|uniref:RagB/SusD family nutrient uptake outer membrane protein n=1 Tax=termite gut metagenome TaxID=433724 RepID=A0A5J4RNZ5_9ZZZZ